MTQIGTLQKNIDGTASGNFRTGRRSAKFVLEPNKEKRGEKSPDYQIYGIARDGSRFELGVAWNIKSKAGRPGYDLKMDDVDWPSPLQAPAWPSEKNENEFRIIWDRKAPDAVAA